MSKRAALIADADETAAAELAKLLEGHGLVPVICHTAAEMMVKADKATEVVFLDQASAELAGAQVLQELRERHPGLPVVMCTADGKKEDVVLALRHTCADWIDKPVTEDAVTDALRRAVKEARHKAVAAPPPAPQARGLIKVIVGRIRDGSIALPEVPRVLDELQRQLADLNAAPEDVLRILEKDPAIAARILATANTATYGGRGRITDLKSAVTRLGNRTISSIAQTAALRGAFTFRLPAFRIIFQKLWTGHCVAAQIARELALEVGEVDPEEVYLICLLHNSGEQFMLRIFAEIFQRQANQAISIEEVLVAIRETHAVFSAGLASKWNMGAALEVVARHHHDESYDQPEFDAQTRRILHLCNAATRLVEEKGLGLYPDPPPGPDLTASYDALNVPDSRKPHFAQRLELIGAEVSLIS